MIKYLNKIKEIGSIFFFGNVVSDGEDGVISIFFFVFYSWRVFKR